METAGSFSSMLIRRLLVPVVVLVLVPVLIVVASVMLLWQLAWGTLLRAWFSRVHRSQGRFILFVYSESPNWQTYIEENILPPIASCAVVLNWSERKRWPSDCPWESRAFHHWAGSQDFNPMAIVFTGRWRVATIRFYQAFRDFKHGREQRLRSSEAELFSYLGPERSDST